MKTFFIDEHQLEYITCWGIITNASEFTRLGLFLAKYEVITPKEYTLQKPNSLHTLMNCENLISQDNISDNIRGSIHALEGVLGPAPEFNFTKNRLYRFPKSVKEFSDEYYKTHNINFSELIRHSLFGHLYFKTPLRFPEENESSKEFNKLILLPQTLIDKIDEEAEKEKRVKSDIVRGSLYYFIRKIKDA